MADISGNEIDSQSLQEDAEPFSIPSNPESVQSPLEEPRDVVSDSQVESESLQPSTISENNSNLIQPSLEQADSTADVNFDPCLPCQIKHDIALAFMEAEEEVAESIMNEMSQLTKDGKPLNLDVCLWNDEFSFGNNKVTRPYIVSESCRVVFVIHTDNKNRNLDSRDCLMDEIISEIRIIRGQDNVLPLHTKAGLHPLIGLASMAPLEWYKESKRADKVFGILEREMKKTRESLLLRMENLRITPVYERWNYNQRGLYLMSDGDCYKMTAVPRGLCVIISNWDFIVSKNNRLAAQDNGVKLKKLFGQLQFKVFLYENKTEEEIERIFDRAARISHRNFDCFVCYITSHGLYNVVLSQDCKKVKISGLARRFRPKNCDSLRNKPKLFFVDACRNKDDVPDNALNDICSGEDERKEEKNCDTNEIKDFFFGYSTQPYSTAYKNPETGPIYTDEFIKAMTKALTEKKDLNSIMTDVSGKVQARALYSGNEECRALPDPDSKLTKELYFM